MKVPRFLALAAAVSQGICALNRDDFHSVELKTFSLAEPYLDADMSSRWWDFGGDTVVRTDKHVRLTPDRSSREGWLFTKVPLSATNWEIEFTFSISGQGSLYGDGFAMWIVKERAQPGKVFGHKDKFEGLGIFFDTYKNNRPGVTFPYVMAMMGDGQTEYDKANDGKANELGGCSARGIRNAHIPTKARLTFFQDHNLVLALQYKEEDDWEQCFDLPNVKIPAPSWLGFSAETGELSDNHDIIHVSTKNLYEEATRKKATDRHKEGYKTYQKQKMRASWGWFFLKFVLFLVACGGGYIGFTAYRARQRSRF